MNITHEIKCYAAKIKYWYLSFNRTNEENINAQDHKLSQEEMLDEEMMESFPASDPPGHRSKSSIDKSQHRR